jgi:hypothetical protein
MNRYVAMLRTLCNGIFLGLANLGEKRLVLSVNTFLSYPGSFREHKAAACL